VEGAALPQTENVDKYQPGRLATRRFDGGFRYSRSADQRRCLHSRVDMSASQDNNPTCMRLLPDINLSATISAPLADSYVVRATRRPLVGGLDMPGVGVPGTETASVLDRSRSDVHA
jgi:hypothetical protein